jgi:hypothetical protein
MEDVMLRIANLSNLGSRIQAQVQRQLAPVRALAATAPRREIFQHDVFEGARHGGAPARSKAKGPSHANADAVARRIASAHPTGATATPAAKRGDRP